MLPAGYSQNMLWPYPLDVWTWGGSNATMLFYLRKMPSLANPQIMRYLQNATNVIPAKAGIQKNQILMDPGLRRGDSFSELCKMLNG